MFSSLDHVILAVRDLDSARANYRRLLGLRPSWNGVHPNDGTANCLFRLENTYLELLAPVEAGPVADLLRAWLAIRGEGLVGLAFETPDLEDCVETLRKKGLEPEETETGQGRDNDSGAERNWRRAPLSPDRTRGIMMFPIQHQSPADALPSAMPTARPASTVHALDHVVVETADAEAAKSLYGDTFGLRLALDRDFPDWGVRLMFYPVGDVTIEVASASGSSSPLLTETVGSRDRLYGMSYRVRDVEAAQRRLAGSGLDVSEVRKGRRPGTRVFTVRNGTCEVPTLMLELEPAHD